jgi:hypothetical protein
MGGSITLIVVLVGIAVGIATLLIYRQRSAARESAANLVAAPKGNHAHKNHPPHKNEAEQWGVRITASAKDQTCPQVRGLLGKEFPLEQKPSLPVKDCPFPQQCGCHYVKLFDRRKSERRSGKERRQAQRFEHGHQDRRSGKDRRKNKNLDWA